MRHTSVSLLILLALNSVHRYQSRLLYFFNRTHIKKTLDAGQKCVIYINIGKSGGGKSLSLFRRCGNIDIYISTYNDSVNVVT